MSKYWILVAAKNHVQQGREGGFAQACHGKSHPLRRMGVGDGMLYYSPKLEYGAGVPYQCFTAIGCVIGESIYQFNMGNDFNPYRRQVTYLNSRDTQIKPLINNLSFIKDKSHWGNIFKFGILQIPMDDFKLIAEKMNVQMKID